MDRIHSILTSVSGITPKRLPLEERVVMAATRRFWSYLDGLVWGSFMLMFLRLWTEIAPWIF
jgi:hypothetical protein